MKRLEFILLCSVVFLVASNVICAQEKSTRIGVGVSLGKEVFDIDDDDVISLLDFPSFYLPILTSSRIRIEPEFGLYRYSRSRTGNDRSSTVLSLGCGFFAITRKGKVDIYYGARFGLLRTSSSYEYSYDSYYEDEDNSKTDYQLSPAVGGEYFFTEHLSLGGEAQLNFIFLGEWNGDDNDDTSESLIRTKTLIFVRWYF